LDQFAPLCPRHRLERVAESRAPPSLYLHERHQVTLPRDQVDLRVPHPKPMRDDRASPRQEVADRLLLPGDPAPVALVGPLRRVGSDTASHRRKPTDPPPVHVTETMPTGPYQCGMSNA